MDGAYSSPLLSSSIAAGATAVCCIFALWTIRFDPRRKNIKKKKACGCDCSCDRPAVAASGDVGMAVDESIAVQRQAGASMMEQLVPEITTHALSYLDYTSLCRLSMANSAMRRAANDDGAWKALFHKDFTADQDSVTPINGWKSYYAATKAIVSVNAEFYNIVSERSLPAMSCFWLQADYVKCIHASGELFAGHSAVIDSWALAFNWVAPGGQEVIFEIRDLDFEIRDVRARVMTDMAWVTMNAYVNVDSGPFHVTNVYERHNGRWYMVHHHSSVMSEGGDPEHLNPFV